MQADEYITEHGHTFEHAVSSALTQVIEERAPDPVARLAELLRGSGNETRALRAKVAEPEQRLATLDETSCGSATTDDVETLRNSMLQAHRAANKARATLADKTRAGVATSRAGYLRSLEEILGPPGKVSWDDHEQWLLMRLMALRARQESEPEGWRGWRGPDGIPKGMWAPVNDAWSDDEVLEWLREDPSTGGHDHGDYATAGRFQEKYRQEQIDLLKKRGWQDEQARIFGMLAAQAPAIGLLLRERRAALAPVAHALYNCMYTRARDAGEELPPMLYRHLKGFSSLVSVDSKWADIETPDATGFCGLCSSGLVNADCSPDNFGNGGYRRRWQKGSEVTYETENSPVVAFESRAHSEFGAHSAVLTFSATAGAFPTCTLFRLRAVKEAGTWEAPGGVYPQQRLLIVTATYLTPRGNEFRAVHTGGGGKMCTAMNTLEYGNRNAFVQGIDALIAKPLLTIAQEFDRDLSWSDWRGVSYTLRDEWAYVNGPAQAKQGCTPGTRDANNDGFTPEKFLALANDKIKQCRADGVGTQMPESHAFLTKEEVLAVRLYSGPAYQPINNFLRQVAKVSGAYREQLAQHPDLTFTATVRELCCAIRKLAAHTPTDQTLPMLYRGVRGKLDESFWKSADAMGIVCAVDMAFMSTSRNQHTPIAYMEPGKNVLWRLFTSPETESGFHMGADIKMLSQYAGEDEVLFPPMTMLQVIRGKGSSRVSLEMNLDDGISPGELAEASRGGKLMTRFTDEDLEKLGAPTPEVDGEKEYTMIDVLPNFL